MALKQLYNFAFEFKAIGLNAEPRNNSKKRGLGRQCSVLLRLTKIPDQSYDFIKLDLKDF
jgi:hypothetical protein